MDLNSFVFVYTVYGLRDAMHESMQNEEEEEEEGEDDDDDDVEEDDMILCVRNMYLLLNYLCAWFQRCHA
jgi:hypothetical protein